MSKFVLVSEEVELLKMVKRKKRLTTKDAPWWSLIHMMRKGALSKVVAKQGKYAGWPHFVITPRGRRFLERLAVRQQQAR
jgi:hypothetical protein